MNWVGGARMVLSGGQVEMPADTVFAGCHITLSYTASIYLPETTSMLGCAVFVEGKGRVELGEWVKGTGLVKNCYVQGVVPSAA